MSVKRRYKKRLIWSEEEERFLIAVWKKNYDKLREHRKTYHIYEEMANELGQQGWTVTTGEVQTKIRNLCVKFRQESKRVGPSGGSASSWVLFNDVKEFLKCNKSLNIKLCKEENLDECSIYEQSQSGMSDDILPPSTSTPTLSPERKQKKSARTKEEIIRVMMKVADVAERKVQAMEERNRLKAEELRIKAEKLEFLKSQTKYE